MRDLSSERKARIAQYEKEKLRDYYTEAYDNEEFADDLVKDYGRARGRTREWMKNRKANRIYALYFHPAKPGCTREEAKKYCEHNCNVCDFGIPISKEEYWRREDIDDELVERSIEREEKNRDGHY